MTLSESLGHFVAMFVCLSSKGDIIFVTLVDLISVLTNAIISKKWNRDTQTMLAWYFFPGGLVCGLII